MGRRGDSLVPSWLTVPVSWLALRGAPCTICRTRGPHGERLYPRVALRQLGPDHAPSGWVCSAACELEAERRYLRLERDALRDETGPRRTPS